MRIILIILAISILSCSNEEHWNRYIFSDFEKAYTLCDPNSKIIQYTGQATKISEENQGAIINVVYNYNQDKKLIISYESNTVNHDWPSNHPFYFSINKDDLDTLCFTSKKACFYSPPYYIYTFKSEIGHLYFSFKSNDDFLSGFKLFIDNLKIHDYQIDDHLCDNCKFETLFKNNQYALKVDNNTYKYYILEVEGEFERKYTIEDYIKIRDLYLMDYRKIFKTGDLISIYIEDDINLGGNEIGLPEFQVVFRDNNIDTIDKLGYMEFDLIYCE